MVAKLKREPPTRRTKEGEEKPPSPVFRSAIKQAMRMKCNTVTSLQKKQVSVHDIYKNLRLSIENLSIVSYVEVIIAYFHFYLMENDF